MNDIPVVFMPASIDACALYRMYLPSLQFSGSDYYHTGFDKKGDPKNMDFNRLVGKKVAVVQRLSSIYNLEAIKSMHVMGIKVIYDLDDNLWNLPHANPAKSKFEEAQYGFSMCAAAADLLTVSTRGLKTAASVSFRFGHEIQIIPNAIDLNLFHKKEIVKDDDYVIIGWGGSNTHTEDVRYVFEAMPDILNKNPKAVMEIVGAPPRRERTQEIRILEIKYGEMKNEGSGEVKKIPAAYKCIDIDTNIECEIPIDLVNHEVKRNANFRNMRSNKHIIRTIVLTPEQMVGRTIDHLALEDSPLAFHERYRFKSWVPVKEFHNRLASWAWDIAIAPLEQIRFNDSKSNIKMLEAAALRIPCLVSPVNPYQEFCALGGEDLKWLLCHNIDEWKNKLTALINEPERRAYLGEKMYQTMLRYYDMAKVKELWNHAFRTALHT